MPRDGVVSEPLDAVGIAASREVLERADANMARGDARQHGAGQDGFAHDVFAGDGGSERPCGRNSERRHRLADDVFAQNRPQRRPAVAAAGKWCRAGALKLDIAADAVGIDDLAEQDSAAIAELRHEMAELVAGIGHGDRLGPVGQALPGEDFGALRALQQVGIEPQPDRERSI